MNTTTTRLFRLSKIIKGINVPYWRDDTTLNEYPQGFRQLLQKRWNDLWIQWREDHPHDILNGKKENRP